MGAGGPRTPQGKTAVAGNAISHGIYALVPVIHGMESAADWEAHRDGVLASLNPVGHLEHELADRVALLLWRLRRATRFETATIAAAQEQVAYSFDHPRPLDSLFAIESGQAPMPSLEATRIGAEHARERVRALEALSSLPDDTPLTEVDLAAVLRTAESRKRRQLEASPEGTLAMARDVLFGGGHRDPVARLAEELTEARDRAVAAERELEKLMARRERSRTEGLIPPGHDLDRVIRYEAHLSRQLYATMHELEALQARRAGAAAPLARLEVSGLPET